MGSVNAVTIPHVSEFNWSTLKSDQKHTPRAIYISHQGVYAHGAAGALLTTSSLRKAIHVVGCTRVHDSIYALHAFGLVTDDQLKGEEEYMNKREEGEKLTRAIGELLTCMSGSLKITSGQLATIRKKIPKVILSDYARDRLLSWEKGYGIKILS